MAGFNDSRPCTGHRPAGFTSNRAPDEWVTLMSDLLLAVFYFYSL
jgi:hypothetical protein